MNFHSFVHIGINVVLKDSVCLCAEAKAAQEIVTCFLGRSPSEVSNYVNWHGQYDIQTVNVMAVSDQGSQTYISHSVAGLISHCHYIPTGLIGCQLDILNVFQYCSCPYLFCVDQVTTNGHYVTLFVKHLHSVAFSKANLCSTSSFYC